MNQTVNKLLFSVANTLALSFLIKATSQGLVMPFYHAVSDKPLNHLKHLYQVPDTKLFERDLDFLLKHYTPIEPDYLLNCVQNPKLRKKNAFLLTFDDGLREFYDVVAPILKRKGVPAICFLNSGFVGNKDLFYRLKASLLIEKLNAGSISKKMIKEIEDVFNLSGLTYYGPADMLKIDWKSRSMLDKLAEILNVDFLEFLKEEQPYMTLNQVKELEMQGFYFGAHSVHHPDFQQINFSDQLAEVKGSIGFVQSHLNQPLKLFSFPFTDFGLQKDFFSHLSEHADITFGTANLKLDQITTNFQRIPMEVAQRTDAETLIKYQYILFLVKKLLGKNIIIR